MPVRPIRDTTYCAGRYTLTSDRRCWTDDRQRIRLDSILFFGVIAKLGLKCEMRGNGTRYVPKMLKYVLARQNKLPQSFLSFLSAACPCHTISCTLHTSGVGLLVASYSRNFCVVEYECVRSPQVEDREGLSFT